jgi:hypothetical protein
LVREHDLAATLRSIPDSERGFRSARTMVKCQSCQAVSAFDSQHVAKRCDFCGSASLVSYDEVKEVIRPESVLPFKQPETTVRETIRRWYGTRWFAPNKLGNRALTDTVHGLYLPYWTFDAQVEADWTADAGYYYWDTESYTDSQGKRQTRQVRKVRWEPASGSVAHFFDDDLVCGSGGVDRKHIRGIEPFPTTDLVPYDAGYVSGWTVERYQIDLGAAAETSREQMESAITSMCSQQVPGDTQRDLQVDARYFDRTFKHILVPVWLLSYTYGSKRYQVVVNGVTGSISGDHPLSAWKIFFLIVGILALIGVFLSMQQQ